MQASYISVPIPTEQFLHLAGFLEDQGSGRDAVDVVRTAIDYWLANASWKQEALIPDAKRKHAVELREGYFWKRLFLPSGSKVRMVYKGRTTVAEVGADGIHHDGKVLSPSAFVHDITQTSRNAWLDVEVQFPDSSSWLLAANLRKHSE